MRYNLRKQYTTEEKFDFKDKVLTKKNTFPSEFIKVKSIKVLKFLS